MPKEILFYSSIYSYSAANFINELEANKGEDICIRGNCPGGDMFSTFGMIAKFNEHPKKKSIKVDGIAASAFAYMCCAADEVECLDASMFLFHRAAYGDLNDEKNMSADEKNILDSVNAQIRAALEKKATTEQFQTITGTSYSELFDMTARKDVILTATQAKALGIVQKITPVTSAIKAEVTALAAQYNIVAFAKEPTITNEVKPTKKMTAAEFKAAHPEAYAAIVKEGADNEKARVTAWLAFKTIDPEAVAKGIEDGKAVDMAVISAMSVKALSAAGLKTAVADNAAAIVTPVAATTEKTEADKAIEANSNELLLALGIKPKTEPVTVK